MNTPAKTAAEIAAMEIIKVVQSYHLLPMHKEEDVTFFVKKLIDTSRKALLDELCDGLDLEWLLICARNHADGSSLKTDKDTLTLITRVRRAREVSK